ncbi:MAG: 1-acyl-sn-glycerol-3-phosphate acyltransferase [Candidatus Rokuibacteriota bacterium]|nr:MAG: 1-acyl-sn-glycerol-3-phosphate acyltransferase [Candidatus Rokubacteria bacterium]
MTATSDVATAPVSPGAAARPARSERRLAYGWRVLRTGVAFLTFGIGAIVVAAVVWPLRLLPRRTDARREVHANHPTLIDVVLLLTRLPQADCIVKTAARRNPLMRRIVTGAGYLANDDGDALVDACADRIGRGRSVVLFPEGTRSPRGGLRRFQRGAAHIALKSGCPIVPVVITCRPPTLLKGQAWHDVPDRTARFVLRVEEPIDPARYLGAETTLPVAARRLTADLQMLYERRLDADEGTT